MSSTVRLAAALPLVVFGAAAVSIGCGSSAPAPQTAAPVPPAPSAAPAPAVPAKPQVQVTLASVGLDALAMDRKVDPCTDFYRYACGAWLEKTQIPNDKARWTRSFNEIDDRNEADLRRILEKAQAEYAPLGTQKVLANSAAASNAGTAPKTGAAAPNTGAAPRTADAVMSKLGVYYAACMDEATVEKLGIKPIEPWLRKVRKMKTLADLSTVVTELHKVGIWPIWDISAEQDFKDATRYIAYLDQGGLGLPDRDYYTKTDAESEKLREKYRAHVEAMLKLAGAKDADAKTSVSAVMDIESELAKRSKTRVERRDPKGLYNKIDRPGVEKTVPSFGWKAYFEGLGHPEIQDVNVTSVPFFTGVNELLTNVPIDSWRRYVEWHVIRSTAKALSKAFVDESFRMEQTLTGQKENRARWKRCIDSTDEALGELLGQPFVAERFAGDSKTAAETYVHAIGDAFSKELDRLSWMDDTTRKVTRDKLAAMAWLIGYPEKWRTYEFPIKRDDYVANVLAARAWELQRQLKKIGKPVDRNEWETTPPTVNAYYHPLKNQMVFPAGILQPPFYSVSSSVAVNLGGMGMVVGHELTHGFDDQGSQFDKHGNLSDWWTNAMRERFKKQTGCVELQYGAYETLPGIKVNGKLTLGENIADLGGVKLAFAAYRALRASAPEMQVAEGFNEDQQFFLALGQVWCSKDREEFARMAAQVDPHSPPRYRVNGSLVDFEEFARSFSCAKGTPMNPNKMCSVW